MDKNTPSGETPTKPLKPARVALNVLALCFALSVLGRGLGESFTVFLKPISESFGWDRAQVVSVYSLSWLTGGLTAPLIGRLFDRSGPRMVYALGLLLLGGAFLIASRAQALWQFQISIGICVGLGIALVGNVPNSILLGRWFGPRLPTAMAVVYSAMGGGVLLLLPASQLMIDHVGWREAYQWFGVIVLCLVVPLMLLPWRLFATGSPQSFRKHKPKSMTAAGRLEARCAITPSGRCSRPSSSPRSACTPSPRRSSLISSMPVSLPCRRRPPGAFPASC